MTEPLLQIRDLVKDFPIKGGILHRTKGHVRAVGGVSVGLADLAQEVVGTKRFRENGRRRVARVARAGLVVPAQQTDIDIIVKTHDV